ncbi:MAG TPA: hypothetical protein VMY77_19020, partial [Chitinophagaceae bacterium]|nr:hypothetical protein [Chitinophagaceae bacterium]
MIRLAAKKNPVLEFCVLIIVILVLSGLLPLQRELLMATATAITFLFAATSKILLHYSDENKKILVTARVLALCTLFIGILRISTIVFDYNAFVFLFGDNINPGAPVNSMVLVTAVGFVLTGTALYLLTLHNA